MSYLLILFHLFIGATLAGVFLVILLVADLASAWTLTVAILAGFLLAFPIARQIERTMRGF